MPSPLIVYLDSQDFSRIAAPPPNKESFYKELESQLAELIDTGAIEIRYSAIHISEIAHTNTGAAKFSAERAAALERLARGKCMRFWYDILDDEIASYFDDTLQIVATAENDLWMEAQTSEIKSFLESMKASIQETLQERGANRKARRVVNKLDLVKILTQTPKGKNTIEQIANDLSEKFPTRAKFDKKILTAYIAGKIDRKVFAEHLHRIIVEPANLIQRIAPILDTDFKLPAIVRNLSHALMNMNPKIEKLTAQIRNFPQVEAFDQLRKDVRAMPAAMMRNVRNTTVRNAVHKNIPNSNAADLTDAVLDDMTLPTIDTLVAMATKYLSDAVVAALNNKPYAKFNASDGGDLSHAAYLPYVDVFRCDTSWTTALKPQGERFGTIVVDRIENLVSAIKAAATQRS
jgi:hypothetical protein